MITRRDFHKLALALPAVAASAKLTNGVMLGAQSYSFRDRPVDDAIAAMKDIGLTYVELWQGHAENEKMKRAELRQWRETVSLDEFSKIGQKLKAAGIELWAYNYSFRDDFSDAEIARGFEMAKALGTNRITASANVTTARRVDPFAQKAKITVGFHNHSRIVKNEFATPDDFEAALKGMSKYTALNLDIGHFWAANFNPVEYLEQHHDQIISLHIKDRGKNQGDNMPFGQGTTPIKEVLQVLKTKKYKIPAMIEYEYKGQDTVAEVRKCFEYCKNALA
ncbi:MAG: sugar phosphate isomerase/epimerase family protein [Bryobacteraceae bacterium]